MPVGLLVRWDIGDRARLPQRHGKPIAGEGVGRRMRRVPTRDLCARHRHGRMLGVPHRELLRRHRYVFVFGFILFFFFL